MSERPMPTQDELDSLATEIAERYDGWVFTGLTTGHGEYAFSAEKVGTYPDRQTAMTPRALMEAIEWRERQLSAAKQKPNIVVGQVTTHEFIHRDGSREEIEEDRNA
jgi:hypothetical protein